MKKLRQLRNALDERIALLLTNWAEKYQPYSYDAINSLYQPAQDGRRYMDEIATLTACRDELDRIAGEEI